MELLVIAVFVIGYAAIALEHNIKIDKAASALLTGMICWTLFSFYLGKTYHGHELKEALEHSMGHHLFDIAGILFFLMGAMTIVELVDAHEGFKVITDQIKTTNAVKLLWIVGLITFFLSSVLDNLTTTIVMISLLRKLIDDKQMRWLFVGLVVIAANAGGAWSPIGDVTTTLLWNGGQLPDVGKMLTHLILPSLVSLILPILALSFSLKGRELARPQADTLSAHKTNPTTDSERKLIFTLGIGGLVFVPVFKTITHLSPFMGMMFSLGILWVVTEIIHRSKNKEDKHPLSVVGVLQKIDVSSVLFFLGILLAVAALQEFGHLGKLAEFLNNSIGDIYIINVAIGFLSSIVDNVPLVAAAQGMYEVAASGEFAANGHFWQFLAYCAGVGGSCLIIGSAAGVAAMGLEKIEFGWYLKKVTWLAVIGYLGGAIVYYLLSMFVFV
ncbi:MAG: sodium:proton antiporter NhaD [Flavobacteriales bacterium]|nr:sodium:proton antiporter NhaD [Flavobacteriales bacterium]